MKMSRAKWRSPQWVGVGGAGSTNFSSNYFEKQLHAKYENEMSEKARDARRRFSAYFGGDSNVISQVRKKIAFHFDRTEIESVYAARIRTTRL
jgi:hypothetical protein